MPVKPKLMLCAALAASLCGCVATQKVPVSTDPVGATVYLDGKVVCAATPCSVEVPKDQDHLLTIVKDGYRQRDVPVRRVYDAVGALREGVREGVRAGNVMGAVKSADDRERDGSDYRLAPDMVTLRLRSLSEPEPAEARSPNGPQDGAQGSGDPVVDLGLELYRLLEGGQPGTQRPAQ